MKITMFGSHLHVKEDVREYAEKRFAHMDRGLDLPPEVECHLSLSVNQNRPHVDVHMHVHNHELTTSVDAETFFAAIDMARDKISHQVEKYRVSHKRHDRQSIRTMKQMVEE